MIDSAVSKRGGNEPDAAPEALAAVLFPAARLAPSRWLGGDVRPREPDADGHGGEWGPAMPFRGAGDIFASGCEGAGAALALALAAGSPRSRAGQELAIRSAEIEQERCFLWVQDHAALRLGGRPYLPGLPEDLRHRLIHVCVRDTSDALFALEEGIRCHDLAFVIGEVAGNPRGLDFTASRRLVLAAERHGVPLWLVRLDARHDLGAARMRWDIASAPSAEAAWNPQAPGAARWRAELFRARGLRPGQWWITQQEGSDGRTDAAPGTRIAAAPAGSGDLAGPVGDRSLAAVAPGG